MKNYNQILVKGFEKRGFDITQIEDNKEQLPWWMKEQWVLTPQESSLANTEIFVTFLIDPSWESGAKLVVEVLLTSAAMQDRLDRTTRLPSLDMIKGNFEEKLDSFWNNFENKYR